MEQVNFHLSEEGDPWFNLALENYIFRTMDPANPVFFVWRNKPSVVLGRYQNPWVECQLRAMRKDHICLARRQSGGGTVYHDWGNTNFTCLCGNHLYHDHLAFHIIGESLKHFGIEAEISERNDLVIPHGGVMKKFSGSAFRKLSDRSFHHGTLLLNADLSKLKQYLTPMDKKLQGRGVKSIRSQVVNLSEINPDLCHDQLVPVLKEKWGTYFGKPVVSTIWKKESVTPMESFQSEYDKLTSYSWVYGKTPPFIHFLEGFIRNEWVTASLHIKEARIVNFESHHPILDKHSQRINSLLTDLSYERGSIEKKLIPKELENLTEKVLPNEISQFIIENIK